MTTPDQHQRGVALVVVLWIVTILALQVSLFNLTVRDAASLGSNELAIARGEELAAAGIELAAAHILDSDPDRRWEATGRPRVVRFGGASLQIVVTDEASRVDVNEAGEEVLASALRPFARSAATTAQWVERILDWRDPDDERRQNGAEAADYKRAGLAYEPRNGPFLHPLEIGRVLGVPPEVAQTLAGRLTAHGIEEKINPLSASRETLMMLPGAKAGEVDHALRLAQRLGDNALAVSEALGSVKDWLTTQTGPAYRIEVTVRDDAQPALGRAEAVILVDRRRRSVLRRSVTNSTPPFHILSWNYEPRALKPEDRDRK
jgi:general secretion pathway protein K